ncbi:MAG: hypothetical protein HGA75_00255 [Thiobacillus sp.]|nr:hypothetical protein [Thiobacillus sp.]
MNATRIALSTLFAGFAAVGIAHADSYYNPANEASSTGMTAGYDLYRTIGCPGQGLFDTDCKAETKPAPVVVVEPAPAPAPVVVVEPAPAPAPVVVAAPAPVQAKAPEYVHPLVSFCLSKH